MTTRKTCLVLAAMVACTLGASAAETKPLAWTGKDTQGNAVTVPATVPTLMVFVRADQPQSKKALEQVGKMTLKDVQVVAVVSGDDAPAAAAKLAATLKSPIVVDEKYAASGAFAVRVWPTTVVITPAGKEVGHIGGFPANYARDLDATLAFAGGKIDKAEFDKRLASTDVVADSVEQKAARHIEVAQRLAAKGMKDAARAEVARAVELKAGESNLRAALARAHLMLGDARAADLLLAKMPETSAELKTLKGWTHVQLERWDDAKKMLEEAIKLNPQPAEASYLLGLVYEHARDYAKAAACYKSAFEHTPAGREMGK